MSEKIPEIEMYTTLECQRCGERLRIKLPTKTEMAGIRVASMLNGFVPETTTECAYVEWLIQQDAASPDVSQMQLRFVGGNAAKNLAALCARSDHGWGNIGTPTGLLCCKRCNASFDSWFAATKKQRREKTEEGK